MEKLKFFEKLEKKRDIAEKTKVSKEKLIVIGLIQKWLTYKILKNKLKELKQKQELLKIFPDDKNLQEEIQRLKADLENKAKIIEVKKWDTLWGICKRYYWVWKISTLVLIPKLGYKEKIIVWEKIPIPLKKYMEYFINKYKEEDNLNPIEETKEDKLLVKVIDLDDISKQFEKNIVKNFDEKKKEAIRWWLVIYGKYLKTYATNLEFVKITFREKLQHNLIEAWNKIINKANDINTISDLESLYQENKRYFEDNYLLDVWNQRLLSDYKKVIDTMKECLSYKLDKVTEEEMNKKLTTIKWKILETIRWIDEHDDGWIIRDSWEHEADLKYMALNHIIRDTEILSPPVLKILGKVKSIPDEEIESCIWKDEQFLKEKLKLWFSFDLPKSLLEDIQTVSIKFFDEAKDGYNDIKDKIKQEDLQMYKKRIAFMYKEKLKEVVVNWYLKQLNNLDEIRKKDKVVDIYCDIQWIGKYDISDEKEDDMKYRFKELAIQVMMISPAIRLGNIPGNIARNLLGSSWRWMLADYSISTLWFTGVYNFEEVLREYNVNDNRWILKSWWEKMKDWKTLWKNFILLWWMKYLKEKWIIEKIERLPVERLREKYWKWWERIGKIISKSWWIWTEWVIAIGLTDIWTLIFDKKHVKEDDVLFGIALIIWLRLEWKIAEGINEIRGEKLRFWFVWWKEKESVVKRWKRWGKVKEGGANNFKWEIIDAKLSKAIRAEKRYDIVYKIIDALEKKNVDLLSKESIQIVKNFLEKYVWSEKFYLDYPEAKRLKNFDKYKEVEYILNEYIKIWRLVEKIRSKKIWLKEKIEELIRRLEEIDIWMVELIRDVVKKKRFTDNNYYYNPQ